MIIFYRFILLLVLCLIVGNRIAYAENPVLRIETKQQEISHSKHLQTAIQGSLENAQKELDKIRDNARSLAAKMQAYERQLGNIEQQMDELDEERKQKQKTVNARSDEISAMMAAMIRMSHAPKEAVLVMPEGLKGKVQASRALGLMTGSMQQEMDRLSAEMANIRNLQDKIALKRDNLAKINAGLIKKQAALQRTTKRRKLLIRALHGESLQEKRQLAILQKQANSLQSLVKGLEVSRATQFEQRFAHIGIPTVKPYISKLMKKPAVTMVRQTKRKKVTSASFARAKGTLTLPVVGKLIGSFGKRRGKNDTLKGIEIRTRNKAQVVSPYQGEVMFTGSFLEYGNMVIIRHSNQYHTLLAGFKSLNCEAGQFLLEGEPIGAMGNSKSSRKLYMELRKDGKSINPKPWIAGYKSKLARK